MSFRNFWLVFAVGITLDTTITLGAPVIQSFTPAYGSASDPTFITIIGSGFSGVPLVVKFNGVTDPAAGATTDTSIQAHVPAGATNGSGPIFVSVAGQGTFSAQNFTVIGPGPYVTGFTPAIGGAGAPVTITGTHFSNPLTVKFNGVTAPGAGTADGETISATVPAAATSGPVSVTTSLGTYTTATNFFVPPAITGFAPSAGRAGTNVIIRGANFLGTSTVQFNGLDATGFLVLSNGAIQVTVPSGAATGLLRVITPAGSAFSSSNFVVQPLITNFSPAFGPVGASITIQGANFNVGTPGIRFNGVPAATPTGVSFGQLTAVVPAGATTGPISVTTTNGSHTNAAHFHLPARIMSFTPTNSPPGSLVTITGENFLDTAAVAFDGTPAASFGVSNNTTLGAVVPAGITTGPITVTTPAGSTNSSGLFYGAPLISGFNPTHGLPGTNVIISGQSFLGATAVRFNGTNAASFVVSNNTTIRAVVQTGASTGPITVIAPAGTNTSAGSFSLDYTANLAVSVTDAPDPQFVGSNVLYTITLQNTGPYNAPGVSLTNTLPPGVNLVSATTTQGTLNTNANPITGSLGQLNNSSSIVVTLTVSPQAAGFMTNTVSVAGQYPDPSPANNTATNGTLVQAIPKLAVSFVAPDLIRLAWSATLTNYMLEAKTNVNTNVWTGVGGVPTVTGGQNLLTQTNNLPTRYFRLHRVP